MVRNLPPLRVRFESPAAVLVMVALSAVPQALPSGQPLESIPIVVSSQAAPLERLAGEELARGLGRRFRETARFEVTDALPQHGRAIVVGTCASVPFASSVLGDDALKAPGSFVVRKVQVDGRDVGLVAGSGPRATLHAAYALLEALGDGFTISYDALGPQRAGPFSLEGWDLADAPVVPERIIFNGHNFLSSCSTWDLPQWEHWIRQAAKMRYTAIMVHAYGNNPMACFTHHGKIKPTGYLTTSVKGRDWGTQHVNDVRRLHGAEGIFREPVFGAKAAQVPDEERVAAAKALMKQVFAFAVAQGLDVVFAIDVDTPSSNPPEMIGTLPDSARLTSRGHALANPDTPEGYDYWRAQAESLLHDYPQISRLVVWFRSRGSTPWRALSVEEFPEAWKAEYARAVAEAPAAGRLEDAPNMFAISRIARAFRRALDASGRRDVTLGAGTWGFGHMEAADAFFPRDVAFLPLDSAIAFDTPQVQGEIRAIGVKRPVVPIVWAHHDDRTYIGRPYTPFSRFASRLREVHAAGFGIIHWTTRPLDIYFKSLAEQVWRSTEDLPLAETCRRMAERSFGPALRDPMGRCLLSWVTEGPQFGRETTDRFIDRPLPEPEETIALYARASRTGGISRGEEALIISLNLRWLPYFEAQRQALGLRPERRTYTPAIEQGHLAMVVFPLRGRAVVSGVIPERTTAP